MLKKDFDDYKPLSICKGQTDLRRHYAGSLQNQDYFQGVYQNTVDHHFYVTLQHHRPLFYTIHGVAIHAANSLKITLTVQRARSDVKIGPAHAHGSRL